MEAGDHAGVDYWWEVRRLSAQDTVMWIAFAATPTTLYRRDYAAYSSCARIHIVSATILTIRRVVLRSRLRITV